MTAIITMQVKHVSVSSRIRTDVRLSRTDQSLLFPHLGNKPLKLGPYEDDCLLELRASSPHFIGTATLVQSFEGLPQRMQAYCKAAELAEEVDKYFFKAGTIIGFCDLLVDNEGEEAKLDFARGHFSVEIMDGLFGIQEERNVLFFPYYIQNAFQTELELFICLVYALGQTKVMTEKTACRDEQVHGLAMQFSLAIAKKMVDFLMKAGTKKEKQTILRLFDQFRESTPLPS